MKKRSDYERVVNLKVTKKRYSHKKEEFRLKVESRGTKPGDSIKAKASDTTLELEIRLAIQKKKKAAAKLRTLRSKFKSIIKEGLLVWQKTIILLKKSGAKKTEEKKRKGLSGWAILLIFLLITGTGIGSCSVLLLPKIMQAQRGRDEPPESLNRWIEGVLIPSLTSKPNEWYDYWYNDLGTVENDIWVVGGVTFTTENYLFKTINFVYYSPDKGKSWRVSWRTDLYENAKFFRAQKVYVKNSGEINILLYDQFGHRITLQTANGGVSWIQK